MLLTNLVQMMRTRGWKDKLTDYCDGKVTCKCVEKALKSKGMKKGAQMYLNMNKSKCKSLRD